LLASLSSYPDALLQLAAAAEVAPAILWQQHWSNQPSGRAVYPSCDGIPPGLGVSALVEDGCWATAIG